MEILLGVSIIANVGFGYMLLRLNQDAAIERQSILAEVQAERVALLNRIQAPEAAVAISMDDDSGLLNTKWEDDQDFNNSIEAIENLEKKLG